MQPQVASRDGLLRVVSNRELMEREQAALNAAQAAQNSPIVQGLAGYIRQCFEAARRERQPVERRMHDNLRARRGEYTPSKLAEIRKTGGSEVYMMLTSVKCRAFSSWLKDVYLGTGEDRPWVVDPTPVPELSPELMIQLGQQVSMESAQAFQMGQMLGETQILQRIEELRAMAERQLADVAEARNERLVNALEDEQIEGGFLQALNEFIDDLGVYPSAILKGPVIRRRQVLQWVETDQGWKAELQDKIVKQWERVDPINIYPAPHSADIDDGFLIEKHSLTRRDLNALRGVPGYNDQAIAMVLDAYGRGGLKDWLTADSVIAAIQERTTWNDSPDVTIDALQFWGSVQGRHLLEWGMPPEQVPDPNNEYDVEAWLIGNWVIKAVLNELPTGKKPYYKTSFEVLPGSFWGNGVADVISDIQQVCNAAARALVNNMGISSGPQVWINSERLPPGEPVSSMFPWKIWQGTNDPLGTTAKAIEFFQPNSNAQELMGVFEFFSRLADDYSGIPRYITGGEVPGGAGRTASGLNMLQNNAGKAIKQVALNIDVFVLDPLLKMHHYYVMRWGEDESIKGDVQIHARGARGIIAKEAAQLRRNEFLATIGSNPQYLQLVGPEGAAAVLRESSKSLDMNPDDIVPDKYTLRTKMALANMAAQQAMQQQPQPGGGEQLMDGSPTTDHFSPRKQ